MQHRCRGRHGRHGALSLLCYIRWNDLGLNPESSTNSCCVFSQTFPSSKCLLSTVSAARRSFSCQRFLPTCCLETSFSPCKCLKATATCGALSWQCLPLIQTSTSATTGGMVGFCRPYGSPPFRTAPRPVQLDLEIRT